MALFDKSFAHEAERFLRRATKRHPGLAALADGTETPRCVQTVIAVPPGNRYGMFVVTDAAFYTWTENGPSDQWVRSPWTSIKTILASTNDKGRHISLFVEFREDGPGISRWTSTTGVEQLSPQRIAGLVSSGVTIVDPYLFNNSTHLRTIVRLATAAGAQLRNDGVHPNFLK